MRANFKEEKVKEAQHLQPKVTTSCANCRQYILFFDNYMKMIEDFHSTVEHSLYLGPSLKTDVFYERGAVFGNRFSYIKEKGYGECRCLATGSVTLEKEGLWCF